MDAHKRMVISDILGKENWQFVVPIYQREYKWTEEECARLVDDIIKCGINGNEHFVGSIVYQLDKNPNLSDLKLYLVDGQQRLTTLLLIVKALNLLAMKRDDDNSCYVASKTSKILYIDIDDKNRGYKVKPSKKDAAVFNAIIQAKSLNAIENNPIIASCKDNRMLNNFKAAYHKLEVLINDGVDIKDIIYNKGLINLSVVEIQLSYEEDAQAIFESINSLGVRLSNSDLVRNYLLMSNKNQQELYSSYWEPIHDTLIGDENMEEFVKHYLHMKKEYSIYDRDLYKEYVKLADFFIENGNPDKKAMLQDLYNVAMIYEPFIKPSKKYSDVTNQLMKELRDMDQSTAYPFLMKVFLDHEKMPEIVTEDVLNKTINLIIVYLVRRVICRVPTNTLRSFMLTLYKRIFKVSANYQRYYDSIYAFLLNVRSNDYLRTAEETSAALVTSPIYRNLKFATYLLDKIENGRYPNIYSERVVANSPTVEHIMPQTLTSTWERMIATNDKTAEEIHRLYIDTLGNLSLSSRKKNSIMSNEEFSKKIEVLKTDGSKYQTLNRDVISFGRFTETEILEREARLASILMDKYCLESVDTQGIRFEDSVEVICTEATNNIFMGATPVSFSFKGREYPADSFSRILVDVTKLLFDAYPEVIKTLAQNHYNPWNDAEDARAVLHYDIDAQKKDTHIAENVYLLTNFSAIYSVQLCAFLMKECGVEADQLIIYLKKDSIKRANTIPQFEKVAIVRRTLQKLSDAGEIIYDYEHMPKSDSFIKFKVAEFNKVLDIDVEPTSWDNGKYASAYYLEYNMAKHRVIVTLKLYSQTVKLQEQLKTVEDKLGLDQADSVFYWHMKSFYIDYDKLMKSDDIAEAFYEQMLGIILQIKLFAIDMKNELKEA